MSNKVIIAVLVLISCACKKARRETLVQEKQIHGFTLRLQYMPEQDQKLLCFRLNVRNSNGAPLVHTDLQRFNYGLDSMFAFVNVADTMRPVDVIRVANGNVNGLEYMVMFSRPNAFSQLNCQLVFKDWLFTSQLMTFQLQGSAITHIDSLSQQI